MKANAFKLSAFFSEPNLKRPEMYSVHEEDNKKRKENIR